MSPAPYKVVVKARIEKVLKRMPESYARRIVDVIASLASNPYPPGARKLTNSDAWRIRVGDYRILYEVIDSELHVYVVRVGHRREVYD